MLNNLVGAIYWKIAGEDVNGCWAMYFFLFGIFGYLDV
jgi:hypothetical protein